MEFARGHILDKRAYLRDGRRAGAARRRYGSYDVAVSGLVLNFVPPAGDYGCRDGAGDAARRHGTAAYVWDYADKMEMMRYFLGRGGGARPGRPLSLDEGRAVSGVQARGAPMRFFRSVGLAGVEAQGHRRADALSGTSMTTGCRSSVGKLPHQGTQCR